MPNTTTLPIVAGVEIDTDSEGRFNLNLLHKASGLEPSKAPAQWLRTKQAKEFVEAVEAETVQICIVSSEGRNGGTFAHELVAVEYAGWISPAFRIKVNQTFIDYRTGKLQQTSHAIPQTLPQALRLAAELAEERDRAIATKAEIGSRREATSMATASTAMRKANRLEVQLDQSQQYCTIKRMQMLYHGQTFNWRLLKSTSNEMGLPPKDVFDANYGTVKAYHVDVWREAYAVTIEQDAA